MNFSFILLPFSFILGLGSG